jgi:hypothetical protein
MRDYQPFFVQIMELFKVVQEKRIVLLLQSEQLAP